MNHTKAAGSLPALYRRRYIPDETVRLQDDEILSVSDEIILTRWKALKPRKDFTHGRSCYFMKRGFKISYFIDEHECRIYTYCDIIETVFNEAENAYTFNDLLVDVIIYDNGFVKVLDLGEIADALEQELITVETAKKSLRLLDELLALIYSGRFSELSRYLEF